MNRIARHLAHGAPPIDRARAAALARALEIARKVLHATHRHVRGTLGGFEENTREWLERMPSGEEFQTVLAAIEKHVRVAPTVEGFVVGPAGALAARRAVFLFTPIMCNEQGLAIDDDTVWRDWFAILNECLREFRR